MQIINNLFTVISFVKRSQITSEAFEPPVTTTGRKLAPSVGASKTGGSL